MQFFFSLSMVILGQAALIGIDLGSEFIKVILI
jgi:activator of 2-hydroxyglutaryl-CoA dehydratase